MKERIVIDLGRMFDGMFEAAQDFGEAFQHGFRPPFCHGVPCDDTVDFYPYYNYPPANVYMNADKSLVFEFALGGFDESSVKLEFQGDYMVLNAKVAETMERKDEYTYFKRRLKLKDIVDQKYFAPDNRFDRSAVDAVFKGGILRVVLPAKPKTEEAAPQGIKVEIKKEKA